MALRVATSAGRLLLTLVMARYFSPQELGLYGIISTTILTSLFITGGDFYVYSQREMLRDKTLGLQYILTNQLTFYAISHILFLPVIFLLFLDKFIPWKFLPLFYVLLVAEHLTSEANRLFIALSKNIVANFILFIKLGVSAYIAILLLYIKPNNVGIDSILLLWFCGCILSLGYSWFHLRRVTRPTSYSLNARNVDWPWIIRGIRVAAPFLVTTISLKIVEYSDRYFIKYFLDESSLGIYTFYYSIASALQILAFTGAIAIYYPKLVQYADSDPTLFKQSLVQMSIHTAVIVVIAIIFLILTIPFLLQFVGKSIYSESIILFWGLIISNVIFIFGLIPHYILYAKKNDKWIIYPTIFSAITSLLLSYLLVPKFGLVGTIATTNICFSLLLFGKAYGACQSVHSGQFK